MSVPGPRKRDFLNDESSLGRNCFIEQLYNSMLSKALVLDTLDCKYGVSLPARNLTGGCLPQ